MGNDPFVTMDEKSTTLGALVAHTIQAVAGEIDSSREHGVFLMQSKIWIHYQGKTSNEGPILVGMAINTTGAEVQAWILADPQDKNDKAEMEKARRSWIMPLALLPREGTGTPSASGIVKPIVINPQWVIPEGSDMIYWSFNSSGSNLTTGASVNFVAHHLQRWLND